MAIAWPGQFLAGIERNAGIHKLDDRAGSSAIVMEQLGIAGCGPDRAAAPMRPTTRADVADPAKARSLSRSAGSAHVLRRTDREGHQRRRCGGMQRRPEIVVEDFERRSHRSNVPKDAPKSNVKTITPGRVDQRGGRIPVHRKQLAGRSGQFRRLSRSISADIQMTLRSRWRIPTSVVCRC